MNIEEYNLEKDRKANRLWKTFTPTQKHMALMYVYRLKTDSEHILDYLETHRFLSTGYNPDDLPSYICKATPGQLYQEAYEVLGKIVPGRKEGA